MVLRVWSLKLDSFKRHVDMNTYQENLNKNIFLCFLHFCCHHQHCNFSCICFPMPDSILLVWQYNSKVEPVIENGNTYPETKTISSENGIQVGTQDKDVVVEGFASVGVYDQWIAPPVSGQRPKARYEVLALALYNNYQINSSVFFLYLYS